MPVVLEYYRWCSNTGLIFLYVVIAEPFGPSTRLASWNIPEAVSQVIFLDNRVN